MLDRLAELHAVQQYQIGDAEINMRMAQYEMAYRMQTSVPDVMDRRSEPASVVRSLWPRSRSNLALSRPTACWPVGWPSATCDSSSSIIPAGTIMAVFRPGFAGNARMWTARRTH